MSDMLQLVVPLGMLNLDKAYISSQLNLLNPIDKLKHVGH
jgi:hypothetical protein